MSTTALAVEQVIIGFFACIWILLGLLRFAVIHVPDKSFLDQASGWSTVFLFCAVAVFYQLGWLITAISWKLEIALFSKKIRDSIFKAKGINYEYARAVVYHKASQELRGDITQDHTVVRLARSGSLNFLLTAVLMFSYGGVIAATGILVLLLSVWCLWLHYISYKRRCWRIYVAYVVVMKQPPEAINSNEILTNGFG